MGCFSMAWLMQLCIWVVIVIAVWRIFNLVLPWLLAQIGVPFIVSVIQIVIWAVIAIMCIYIIFMILGCLLGSGGGLLHFPTR